MNNLQAAKQEWIEYLQNLTRDMTDKEFKAFEHSCHRVMEKLRKEAIRTRAVPQVIDRQKIIAHRKTLQEHRLSVGMTIREAAALSNIPARSIRRWEKLGAGKVDAFRLCDLLDVYGVSMDFTDFDRTATPDQIVQSIIFGTIDPETKIIDLDRALELMKSEKIDVSNLETYLQGLEERRQEKTPSAAATAEGA